MLAKAVLVALIAVSALSVCPGIASPAGPIGPSISSSAPGMDRVDGRMDGKMDAKMDQMINEAMQRIESIKQRQKKQTAEGDPALSLLQNNSTSQNTTLQNSTLQNSTLQNSTLQNSTQNIASGSKNRFNGLYAVSASRHEMGKSGVESKMVLNGTFEMDKSVKFQDQGF